MRNTFARLLLLAVAPVTIAQHSTERKSPFAIQLSIVSASLREEMFQRNGAFQVDANITNVSGENQTIMVWTQPGWSWLSDNRLITPDTSALKNFPSTRVLRSGEVCTERVWLIFFPRAEGTVTFRLGFSPRTKFALSDRPNEIPRDQLSWSNVVTLTP